MEFVALIAVWILLSILAARIAEKKGRRGTFYFLVSQIRPLSWREALENRAFTIVTVGSASSRPTRPKRMPPP
jgi:hypothetical protein